MNSAAEKENFGVLTKLLGMGRKLEKLAWGKNLVTSFRKSTKARARFCSAPSLRQPAELDRLSASRYDFLGVPSRCAGPPSTHIFGTQP